MHHHLLGWQFAVAKLATARMSRRGHNVTSYNHSWQINPKAAVTDRRMHHQATHRSALWDAHAVADLGEGMFANWRYTEPGHRPGALVEGQIGDQAADADQDAGYYDGPDNNLLLAKESDQEQVGIRDEDAQQGHRSSRTSAELHHHT